MRCLSVASLLIMLVLSCKSVSKYPIADASEADLEDRIVGKWKFKEDTNSNNFYEVIPRKEPYATDRYHIKFWDRGGKNPTYEGNFHFSKIDGVTFLNMPYFERGFSHRGYFFLRILEVNDGFTKITAATVYDTTLWDLNSAAEVKARITQNLNNPSFYKDTIHLHKVPAYPDFVPRGK